MYVKFKTNIKAARHLSTAFQTHISPSDESQLPPPPATLLCGQNPKQAHPKEGRISTEPPKDKVGDVFVDIAGVLVYTVPSTLT